MQTERDAEIVRWLGRIGAASAEHVMARFNMGRSWAYDRLSRLVRDGLLEQKTLLYRQPGLYIATAEGLRWTLQERLGVYRVGAGGFTHAAEVASTVALHRALPEWGQRSERELRVGEGFSGDDPINLSDPTGDAPSKAACAAMIVLAFCDMNGGTELQEQVERVTRAEAAGQVEAEEEGDLTTQELLDALLSEFLP